MMSVVAVAAVAPTDRRPSFVVLLPAIQAHARAAFRSLRCPHDREDAEAEVVGRTWERFRLVRNLAVVAPDRLVAPAVAAVRLALARRHA